MSRVQDPDDQSLLSRFAEAGDESAFRDLVKKHIGLVFSAAQRRTGDRSLAEEASQNAFAILARKAAKLASHPSLPAWLHRTAVYEASKIHRRESSRRRTMKTYGEHLEVAIDPDNGTLPKSWEEAKPELDAAIAGLSNRDREVILQRFYEDRSYAEISNQNGTSEAASRMRVSRALAKLSRILSARGVTLSATALATGLGASLSEGAPAGMGASVSSSALATSPSLTGGTLLLNTIQSMNGAKVATVSSILIFAASAIPIAWQASEAAAIRNELTALSAERARLESGRQGSGSNAGSSRLSGIVGGPGDPLTTMTGEELLELSTRAVKMNELLPWLRSAQAVSMLGDAELIDLVRQVRAVEVPELQKENTYELLMMVLGDINRLAALDLALEIGANPLINRTHILNWASEEPRAAFDWFRNHQRHGAFDEKRVHSRSRMGITATIANAVVKSDPAFAVELATLLENEERNTLNYLAVILPKGDATQAQLLDYFGRLSNTEKVLQRDKLIRSIRENRSRDEAGQFVDSLNLGPDARLRALVSAAAGDFTDRDSEATQEAVDWILTRYPADDRRQSAEALDQIIAETPVPTTPKSKFVNTTAPLLGPGPGESTR